MNHRPIVLLDCDGPMANFTDRYLDAVFDETGVRLTVTDIDRWEIHETIAFKAIAALHANGDHKVLRKRVDEHVSRPGFCSSIRPSAGALAVFSELSESADVFVVTAPWHSSPTWMSERSAWVRTHFGIAPTNVIHAARKHLIRGDFFVDDKPSHVDEWQAAWPSGTGILFDLHHNRSVESGARGGWPEVTALVKAWKVAA